VDQTPLFFELRDLPSVTEILEDKNIKALPMRLELPQELVKSLVKTAVSELRARRGKRSGAPILSRNDLHNLIVKEVSSSAERLALQRMKKVINATGVIVHTNLGRVPLGEKLVSALARDFTGYLNLEYDLTIGERSRRGIFVENLLKELSGAEDALLVNNNAGAVFLILHTLCYKKEVIVSRGELVQIGGGFKIPEIMRASGAKLVEVGTTNKTSLSDYEASLTEKTSAILKVHKSNFVQIGFVEEVGVEELTKLAKKAGVLLIEDMGAGTLIPENLANRLRINHPGNSIRLGVDLICFSGDKILGLTQGGVILGKRGAIEKLRKSPVYRTLRPDKTLLKIMEAGLSMILDGTLEEIPFYRIIQTTTTELRKRGESILHKLKGSRIPAELLPTTSEVGGGFPGCEIESVAISISARSIGGTKRLIEFARKLRLLSIPIIAIIREQSIMFDLRTVLPQEDAELVDGIVTAFSSSA